MTPDELDALLGAYALDALDEDERREVEAYLADNPRARAEVETHRAVATRYDKRDYTFRGTIDLASIRIWLRDPVP